MLRKSNNEQKFVGNSDEIQFEAKNTRKQNKDNKLNTSLSKVVGKK
jgi:hypothetical protein